MSQLSTLDENRQAELLREAASRYVTAVVTCRIDDGWTSFKSRFLGMDPQSQHLFLEYPSSPGEMAPEIVPGQSIGVSFRRGHKKCVFSTTVLGRCPAPFAQMRDIPALKLHWPDQMRELQRRLYYRAPVPEGMTIPAELWRADAQGRRPPGAPVYRGTMLDLSAGGVSIALLGDNSPRWHTGDPVSAAFPVDPGEPAVAVAGRLCHYEGIADGVMRVGLSFVGLDASPDQGDTLERVIRLVLRFQRAVRGRLENPL